MRMRAKFGYFRVPFADSETFFLSRISVEIEKKEEAEKIFALIFEFLTEIGAEIGSESPVVFGDSICGKEVWFHLL